MANQNDNRLRASIPITGIDTATPDISVQDGKCAELHNLRWASSGWRDVKPLETKVDFNDTADTLPISLKIVYHHPAAGDDVYIASIEGSGDNINLCQVQCVDGEIQMLNPIGSNVNPIYVDHYRDSNMRVNMALRSFKPVASDVSAYIGYIDYYTQSKDGDTFTIKKGECISEFVKHATAENIPSAPEPASDSTYSYPIFMSKAEAWDSSVFVRNIFPSVVVNHFGNTLTIADLKLKTVDYLYIKDGKYLSFTIPSPPAINQNTQLALSPNNEGKATQIARIEKIIDKEEGVTGVDGMSFYYSRLYNISQGMFYYPQTLGKHFWGEICYFAIFQMADGTEVSPSALNIASSEALTDDGPGNMYWTEKGWKEFQVTHLKAYKDSSGDLICGVSEGVGFDIPPKTIITYLGFAIRPYISITIPPGINKDLIKFVNIYSTRINPIWDSEKLSVLVAGNKPHISSCFAQNTLPQQPFYLLKSIELEDKKSNKIEMYLDSDLFNGLEQSQAYVPVDPHSLFYTHSCDYNSRLHATGEVASRLFEGYKDEVFAEGYVKTQNRGMAVEVSIMDIRYQTAVPVSYTLALGCVGSRILSYPDFRAQIIREYNTQTNITTSVQRMIRAIANNYSYCTAQPGVYVKYPTNFGKNLTAGSEPIDPKPVLVSSYNKLRVSAPNNPYVFPVANTYSFGTGSNKIININSAAIEMSDAKFGEFPLYAFTEEGIFALQSGSGEVLYSAVIPLNYDKIINPHTLAVNHNVLYVTSRGVHAMSSNKGNLISQPLNNLHDSPPLNYLKDARFCYQHPFNEVIIWNQSLGDWAYVYSLDGGYWSTRDFEGVKLNTDEFVVQHTSGMYKILDLNSEVASSTPTEIKIITRPIKFGSMEFKRLETLIPRLTADVAVGMHVELEASQDRLTWLPLRSGYFNVLRDLTLRRVPFSFRYLRISITAQVPSNLELSGIDAEYYNRFTHKLR